MGASHPGSEATPRAWEKATQVALETVAEGGPLRGVLDFLCRTMEEESLDRVIACIHPVNEDATMFCDGAAPSLDKSYREATDGVLVSSMIGPCCYAVASRQTVVVPEVATDSKWVKFREFSDPLGIRSAWSTPIFSNERKVLGTFAHYYFEVRDPSPRDKRMVELLIRAAAVTIERSRAEAALRELNETLEQRVQAETRERLQIWNVSQDLLVISDLDGKILSTNPAWAVTLGWSEAELLGKAPEWLMHPDDRDRTSAELDLLAKGHKTLHFENRLRAKDGSYHWMSWTAAPDSGRIYGMARDITEQKQAEEALRKSERNLRSAIDGIPGLIAILAPNGEVETINRQLVEYSGLSLERLKTWDTDGTIHRQDVPRLAEVFNRSIAAGVPYQIEARFRRIDGEYRWFDMRGVPVRDTSDHIARWYVLLTDIEDRKRTEEALRESEQHLRSAIDGIPGFVAILAANGEIETVNRQIGEYSGRSLEELRSWATSGTVHHEDLSHVAETFTRAIAAGVPFQYEGRMRRHDGEFRWFEVRGIPVRDDVGRIVRWYTLLTDVEDRKRAEGALRESEQKLRSAIDGIPGLVGVLAPNGDVETVNRQILEYCGQSLEELRNWGTNGTIHPEDLPHVVEVFSKSIASGIPYLIEQRLRRFDGEYRWFDNRGVPIRDSSGRVARWYVLLTDIEERTRALTQLHQMQSDFARMNRVSMMGELAASLSHEITQPIASARNNARAALNFLDKPSPDMHEVREALDCVVGDTDRAGNIIGRIRDQVRKVPPRKEYFDLNAAISEVIALARSAIIRNGVSVQTRLVDGLAPIHADRVQLQQVILNLVLNAVEAMGSIKEGARDLLISTEQADRGVLVAVHDSGPGIDPTLLDRVFQAFYTTKPSGTGMGLSICRSIIAAHGGQLWAEKNNPLGAVFQFNLPGVEIRS